MREIREIYNNIFLFSVKILSICSTLYITYYDLSFNDIQMDDFFIDNCIAKKCTKRKEKGLFRLTIFIDDTNVS